MKTTEFTMPEITISYKDNVKTSEREGCKLNCVSKEKK